MPNRNYEAGRRKEYRKMTELKNMGYTVMRTAGSHGIFDVIGIKPPTGHIQGRIIFLQLKTGESMDYQIKKANEEVNGYSGMYLVEARAE